MTPAVDSSIIKNWSALIALTGVGRERLERTIKLHGFPKPRKVRRGQTINCEWDRPTVEEWISKNGPLKKG